MSNGIRGAGPATVSTPSTEAANNQAETTSPADSQQPKETPAQTPPAHANSMRGDLGFSGQMQEILLRNSFDGNSPLPQTNVAQASPAGDPNALRMKTLAGELEKANVPKNLRDDLLAQLSKKSGAELKQGLDRSEQALKSKDVNGEVKSLVTQGKIDAYFQSFNSTYEVNGKKVQAAPHFRMTNGASGQPNRTEFSQVRSDLQKTIQSHDKGKPKDQQLWSPKMYDAIKYVAGGKGSAEQVQMVTDALIKSGEFEKTKAKHPGLSDSDTIRMMQWEHGVGIDCAGYVSQAFVGVHGGTPGKYGLQQVNNENLMYLKGNKNFAQVKPQEVRAGDLIALDPPKKGDVGHTVLVRDHRVATNDDRNRFVHRDDGFSKRSDKIHIYEVDASWGAGQSGNLEGGMQRRVWVYNETTGKWGETKPDKDGDLEVWTSTTNGPYDHPMNGIYRPKS